MVLPVAQVREMGALACATMAGVTSVAVPLVVVFVHMIADPQTDGNDHMFNVGNGEDAGWGNFLSNAVGGVAFAFSGQVKHPRICIDRS